MNIFIFIIAVALFIGFIGKDIYKKYKEESKHIRLEEDKSDLYF